MSKPDRSIPAFVLPYIHDLADTTEAHGSAVLCGNDDFHFSHTQATQYRNYYDALRRVDQINSIIEHFYPQTDPLFGWGLLAFHEPIVVELAPIPQYSPLMTPDEREETKQARRAVPGRLEIHKRRHPCPTLAMWLVRGIASPTLVPNYDAPQLMARKRRLLQQIYPTHHTWTPWLIENLNRMKITQRAGGAWIGIARYSVSAI